MPIKRPQESYRTNTSSRIIYPLPVEPVYPIRKIHVVDKERGQSTKILIRGTNYTPDTSECSGNHVDHLA